MTDRNPDGRGSHVDRRKFVAGMSAFGLGGAAGCLSDGGGDGTATPTVTPTTTESAPPDTATPAPTDTTTGGETPTEPSFGRLPEGLTYQFFEGVESLSSLGNRTPTSSGEIDHMTTDPEDGPGVFRYTGTVSMGERLFAGTYEFASDPDLLSAGRLRLLVDGNEIQFSGDTRSLRFSEGTHDLTVEFRQEGAGDQVTLGWRGPLGGLLPRVAETDPFRSALQAGGQYEMHVGETLETKQMQMPDSGSEESRRSLAVGPPSYRNFCVDLNTAAIPYAWFGAFLDYGPVVAYGSGRGDDPGQPLGETFDVGGVDYPIRIGNPDDEPTVEFLRHRERPAFELHHAVDGTHVIQEVEGVVGDLGLTYTVRFADELSRRVYFLTAEDAPIEREASVGTWNGGTLAVDEQVDAFTVTVTNTEVGP
jgi:hypothetical protein